MDQTIRFLAASDGVRIAYAESGSGPPLVKAANWLSHLEFDWQSPVWRHWFSFLSSRHRLFRYDERGCGLSDWTCDDLSLDRQVKDLESVVAAVGLERFPLLGISQGGAIAIEYAVRHPESVTHLVLYGTYAQGPYLRGEERARRHRAMMELVRTGWGDDNPAFRQLFASIFIPEAKPEQVRWFGELMARTTNPHMAARILEAFATVDLTARLAYVRCPTIVLHARDDYVPFEQGRMLAAGIPGARFSALEGRNHILLEDESAWPRFRAAVHDFLGESIAASASAGALDDLTVREREILCLVARGHSNLLIGSKLNISEKTVRNHLTNVFDKLQVGSRAQAIVFARDHGVVSDVR